MRERDRRVRVVADGLERLGRYERQENIGHRIVASRDRRKRLAEDRIERAGRHAGMHDVSSVDMNEEPPDWGRLQPVVAHRIGRRRRDRCRVVPGAIRADHHVLERHRAERPGGRLPGDRDRRGYVAGIGSTAIVAAAAGQQDRGHEPEVSHAPILLWFIDGPRQRATAVRCLWAACTQFSNVAV